MSALNVGGRLAGLALLAFATVGASDCQRPVRRWSFLQVTASGQEEQVVPEKTQVGGVVDDTYGFGALPFFPPGGGPGARADVFSSEGGENLWVAAQAPSRDDLVGDGSHLTQQQRFLKLRRDATLRLVVSQAHMEAIDGNGSVLIPVDCPWSLPSATSYPCRRVLSAWLSLDVQAATVEEPEAFFTTGGMAELFGWASTWDLAAVSWGDAPLPLWDRSSFELDPMVEGAPMWARLRLTGPITVEVPLDSVSVGEAFDVEVVAKASALNFRQRESYVGAFLRDPVGTDGLTLEHTGLLPMVTPTTRPPVAPASPAPPCAGEPDPAAGTLEFAAPSFDAPEVLGDRAFVEVRRVGGTSGAVGATLTTSDGTAFAGSDYIETATPVFFADGEGGSRAVPIALLTDDVAEEDEELTVTLSDPRGCAALGAQATATLAVLDDDRPIEEDPTFTVSGEVRGLEGTGLRLLEVVTGIDVTPGNGVFTFNYEYPEDSTYEVRVIAQPQGPFQVCTVTNASGTVVDHDVTDVLVTCVTPPASGELDTSFGGGRVFQTQAGGIEALALQPDGSIVTVGGTTLARYLADGSLDPGFGTAGIVAAVLGGASGDAAHALALQADGKIVVAGSKRGALDDFAVARFLADGTPDPTFGSGGRVTTDFAGLTDRAWGVAVDDTGRIVVGGHAAHSSPLGNDNDFALARYLPDGSLDPAFGAGGVLTVNIAGRTDLAAALALTPDGDIVLAGRVADGGADDPDVGLVRVDGAGIPDAGFGTGGIVRHGVAAGWDEATALAVQPDGAIVVAAEAIFGSTYLMAVARFTPDGEPDLTFGTSGLASTAFSAHNDFSNAVALQPDGKIVVAGQSSNLVAPDFAVARFDAAGVLDTSFGNHGRVTVDFFAASDSARAVAVQPDGKIVLGGLVRNGTTLGAGLARVEP